MTDQRRSGDKDRPNRSNKPTGRSSTGGGGSKSRDGKPRSGTAGRGSKSRSNYGLAKGSGQNASASGDGKPRRDGDFKPRGTSGKPRGTAGRSDDRQGRDERPRRDGDFKPRGSSGKPRGTAGRSDDRQGRDERPRRDGDFKPRGSSGKPRGTAGRSDDRQGRDERPRRDGDFKPRGSSGKPRGTAGRSDDRQGRDERPRRDGDFKPRGSSGKPRGTAGRSDDRQGRDERPRRDGDFKPRGSSGKPRGTAGRSDDRQGRDERPRRDGDFKPRGSGQRGDRGRSDDRPPGRDTGRDEWEHDTSDDLPWPEEIFELELEPEVYKDIEAFGGRTETFAKHLLSVQVLAESDPEMAYQHATRVRDRVSRSALARHTACIAAYRTSRFKEAIKEESAYRRISGRFDLIPIAADSERGLGRPQRTLALLAEYEAEKLDTDTRTELLIVAGGARRDLGDDDAARVLFQKAVRTARSPMATARSRYALGDLLAATGEIQDARKWLQSAVEVDEDSAWTDAAEVLETLA